MYLYGIFDRYLLQSMSLPLGLPMTGHSAGVRARRLLANRDYSEVKHAAAAIDWIYASLSLADEEKAAAWGLPPLLFDEGHHYVADEMEMQGAFLAEIIMEFRDGFGLSDYEDFPGGTWAEYLAVIALGFVGLALDHLEGATSLGAETPYVHSDWRGVTDAVAEASAAIIYADLLEEHASVSFMKDESRKQREKQIIRLQTQKAAIARHRGAARIKQSFIDFFRAATFPSKAEAARHFFAGLSNEEQLAICPSRRPENAVRTLLNVLPKN